MKEKMLFLAALAIAVTSCGSSAATGTTSTTSISNSTTRAAAPGVSSSLSSIKSKFGQILASSSGFTYYMFEPDSAHKSTCYSSCATVWPPVTTTGSNIPASNGVQKTLITIITRTDGTKQIVYNGHPLYTYTGDSGPNFTNGQGVNSYGGYWYVISIEGQPITQSSSTSPSTGGATNAPY